MNKIKGIEKLIKNAPTELELEILDLNLSGDIKSYLKTIAEINRSLVTCKEFMALDKSMEYLTIQMRMIKLLKLIRDNSL